MYIRICFRPIRVRENKKRARLKKDSKVNYICGKSINTHMYLWAAPPLEVGRGYKSPPLLKSEGYSGVQTAAQRIQIKVGLLLSF